MFGMTLEVVVAVMCILCLFLGCASNGDAGDVASIKEYWSQIEDSEMRSHIHDTEKFWHDIDILYRASIERGDSQAFRILLGIRSYTDGAVGECMPVESTVIEKWPEMSREVIMGDERLSKQFGHLLRDKSTQEESGSAKKQGSR